jgi:hypothetical protein
MLAVYLIGAGINDVIDLDNQKSEERRETFRQAAYARTRRAATIKQNREQLWEETICK